MGHLDIELIRQLLGGQVDPDVRHGWEEHLAGCQRCRALVASEKAFSALLRLDQGPPPVESSAERLLTRLVARGPQSATRRRRRRALAISGAVLGASVVSVLGVALWSRPSESERMARALGISTGTQSAIVANLTALEALARDPWLADDLEAVRMLDRLIIEEGW